MPKPSLCPLCDLAIEGDEGAMEAHTTECVRDLLRGVPCDAGDCRSASEAVALRLRGARVVDGSVSRAGVATMRHSWVQARGGAWFDPTHHQLRDELGIASAPAVGLFAAGGPRPLPVGSGFLMMAEGRFPPRQRGAL